MHHSQFYNTIVTIAVIIHPNLFCALFFDDDDDFYFEWTYNNIGPTRCIVLFNEMLILNR